MRASDTRRIGELIVLAAVVATVASASATDFSVLFGTQTNGAVFDDLNVFLVSRGAPAQTVRIVNLGWQSSASTPMAAQLAPALTAWQVSGAVPVLAWMPYAFNDWTAPNPNELIAQGRYDEYLDDFFTTLSTAFVFGQVPPRRLFIEFAPAPNGNWFPWAPTCPPCSGNGQNIGQSAASYIAMFNYVVGFSRREKYRLANDTVQWIFDVATYDANGPARIYYPGANVTDWTALTGANYGTTINGNSWVTPSQLLSSQLAAVRAFAPEKPVALLEVSSVSIPHGVDAKGKWLETLLSVTVPASAAAIRMVGLANEDAGPSDLAVFGGQRGSSLWTAPFPDGGAYWTFDRLAAALGNATDGVHYVGLAPTNARLISDAAFAGRA
mmetsp:Transcript_46650/g.143851  ORF Transcript_46650/g.143851 Transcript_46650/m.143851 type:complete len:383 (-) Transcript_46650:7-1155(-)